MIGNAYRKPKWHHVGDAIQTSILAVTGIKSTIMTESRLYNANITMQTPSSICTPTFANKKVKGLFSTSTSFGMIHTCRLLKQ